MSSSLIVSIPNKTCIHVNPLYQALQELREKLGGKKRYQKHLLCFLEEKRSYLSLLGNTIRSVNEVTKLYANTQGPKEENGFETVSCLC